MKISFLALPIMFLALFSLGSKDAHASFESDALNLLRGISSQVDVIRTYSGTNNTYQLTRLDTLESKLDRLYESCGRGTATQTRRVTLAQVNTCVNSCFTTSAVGARELGAVDPQNFTACVSRCPSNTLRNIECAQRYTHATLTEVEVSSGEYIVASRTAAAYAQFCSRLNGGRYDALCRVYADTHASNLSACLFDQAAYTCQSDCVRNYRNEAGHILCQLRCQNRTRGAQTFEQLQESGLINEDGRLVMDVQRETVIENVPRTSPSVPSTGVPTTDISIMNTPAPETYSQCVYRCDSERTSCLAQVPQPPTCQSTYDACYTGCSSRLIRGTAGSGS